MPAATVVVVVGATVVVGASVVVVGLTIGRRVVVVVGASVVVVVAASVVVVVAASVVVVVAASVVVVVAASVVVVVAASVVVVVAASVVVVVASGSSLKTNFVTSLKPIVTVVVVTAGNVYPAGGTVSVTLHVAPDGPLKPMAAALTLPLTSPLEPATGAPDTASPWASSSETMIGWTAGFGAGLTQSWMLKVAPSSSSWVCASCFSTRPWPPTMKHAGPALRLLP